MTGDVWEDEKTKREMKNVINNEALSYERKTRGFGKTMLPMWTLLVESVWTDITVTPARLTRLPASYP